MDNFAMYMSEMLRIKSQIQRDIIPLATPSELDDIRNGKTNQLTIDKLSQIGKRLYQESNKSDEMLYCVCMAIGTIIKEYDWGFKYITETGMCEIAQKVTM